MEELILAVDKFICESLNFEVVEYKFRFSDARCYVPRFLTEVQWTCDTDHMVSKYYGYSKNTDAYGVFNKFYAELDRANKRAMIEWILNNRKRGWL